MPKRNIYKLARQTNNFTKKPSVRQKLEMSKKRHDRIRNEVANYDEVYYVCNEDGTSTKHVVKANQFEWGIFNKRGYRALELFATKEEAEEKLKTYKRPDFCEVRHIEWFDEEGE